ncbi:PRC-barrel domain-containing protein [Paeniglutamicibacter antarcticus]|uniref:PRC-barrel domain-containing protein n=1 Tax=Paeniglutamicibacter antarcticus TaxID=494023 RepID=A0ABP9THM5_9MICC
MPGEDYLNTLKKAKSTVYGPNREKVGTMGNIFVDRNTGDPDFVSVHVGLFGSEECLVPLSGAVFTDGHLQVRFPKDVIKRAPNIDPAAELNHHAKDLLDRYYSAMDPDTGS